MHMSDALLSPLTGSAFWAFSAGMISFASKKFRTESDGSKTVLMGVLGAFVFASQMINFTIPGTGSSGHIGGGLLLTVLLGPWRAFITLTSVLVIQALFFADGGVLALGCNIFNMAFIPAFIAWPLLYKPLAGNGQTPARVAAASVTAATLGLLAGALSVVIQTSLSGIADLPFGTFVLFMLPIHAAIGIVEGILTWGVLSFISTTDPALLEISRETQSSKTGMVTAILFIAALAIGGALSWFASASPDGLEWSVAKVTGKEELISPTETIHRFFAEVQETTALLPDYDFRRTTIDTESEPAGTTSPVNPGTSLSGIVGSLMVLFMAGSAGMLIRKRTPADEKA